jgi:hypothetical protein
MFLFIGTVDMYECSLSDQLQKSWTEDSFLSETLGILNCFSIIYERNNYHYSAIYHT